MIIQTFHRRPWWRTAKEDDKFHVLWEPYRKPARFKDIGLRNRRAYNHLENNACLVTKRGILLSMKKHYESTGRDVFTAIPVSYLLAGDGCDDEFGKFKAHFHRNQAEINNLQAPKITVKKKRKKKKNRTKGTGNQHCEEDTQRSRNLWIVKPASYSNRGSNIEVVDSCEAVKACIGGSTSHSHWIVQKYIEKPLLIQSRKFDIRCLVLVVPNASTKTFKAFFWKHSYVRTSSKAYSLSNIKDREIHLTNDAIQKHGTGYGKHEAGNKLTLPEFQDYLDSCCREGEEGIVTKKIIPRMKELIGESLAAVRNEINPNSRGFCFEQFGYDFMVSESFEVSLLEVNSNPCLEFSAPFLEQNLPNMIEEVFQKALDPIFPPRSARHREQAEQFPVLDDFELVAEVSWEETDTTTKPGPASSPVSVPAPAASSPTSVPVPEPEPASESKSNIKTERKPRSKSRGEGG
jgi:tubulin polyglutamylase TTLL1/tubulin monoglycylase TTLL3/8